MDFSIETPPAPIMIRFVPKWIISMQVIWFASTSATWTVSQQKLESTKARINGGSDLGSRGSCTATARFWTCCCCASDVALKPCFTPTTVCTKPRFIPLLTPLRGRRAPTTVTPTPRFTPTIRPCAVCTNLRFTPTTVLRYPSYAYKAVSSLTPIISCSE